jgi:hypothetical protein
MAFVIRLPSHSVALRLHAHFTALNAAAEAAQQPQPFITPAWVQLTDGTMSLFVNAAQYTGDAQQGDSPQLTRVLRSTIQALLDAVEPGLVFEDWDSLADPAAPGWRARCMYHPKAVREAADGGRLEWAIPVGEVVLL